MIIIITTFVNYSQVFTQRQITFSWIK